MKTHCGPLLRKEPHPEHRFTWSGDQKYIVEDCPGFEKIEVIGWKSFFESFAYKPNFHLMYESIFGAESVRITMRVPDSRALDVTKTTAVQQTHILEPWDSFGPGAEDFARHWIRRAIQDLEFHEIDENLRFNGELVFDPHK